MTMITAVNEFLDDLRGGRMTEPPVVSVEHGQLQGRVVPSPSGRCYYSFQGIPYAKPPLGSLRFKAPQPLEPWEGIRDATAEGNVSAQIDNLIHKQYIGDENCLFLNVYTPNIDGEFLPVMVYIHGGGFRYGSGNTSLYGPDYLVEKDVVIVTINYRCGALGFLSLNTPEVPGNAGLKDMVQALKWVKNNIHNFGGNSGNITLFGESAGGVAVSLLTASPLTKDLVDKAIIQSGTALNSWGFQKNPINNAKNLAKALGCDSDDIDDILQHLLATSAKDIVEANAKLHQPEVFYEKASNIFAPVVEKEFNDTESFLTENFIDILTSGRVAEIPVMIGSTTLEFTWERTIDDLQAFIPEDLNIQRNSEESLTITDKIKDLYFKGKPIGVETLTEYFQLLSDRLINVDTHRYIQYLIHVSKKPIYYYKFDYVGELNINKKLMTSLGLKHAAHMDELGYLFKNVLLKDFEATPEDVKMRETMLRLWTNFAKSGNPTPEENHYITVTWLPVTQDNLYYLNLASELSLATSPDKEKMEFWQGLYTKHFKIWEHPKTNNEEASPKQTKEVTITETIVTDPETFVKTDEDTKIVVESVTTVENHFETTEGVEVTTITREIHVNEQPRVEIVKTVEKDDVEPEIKTLNDQKDQEHDKIDIVEEIKTQINQKPEETIQNGNKTNAENIKTIQNENAALESEIKVVQEEIKHQMVDENAALESEIKVVQQEIKHQMVNNEIKSYENKLKDTNTNGNYKTAQYINGGSNGIDKTTRPSNEIKMVQSNGEPKDVIRANDPPEDDLPKNIGVNKFVNFFESLGGKK